MVELMVVERVVLKVAYWVDATDALTVGKTAEMTGKTWV